MSPKTALAASRAAVDVAINRLARLVVHARDEGGLSSGDRAELRRMDPLGIALPPVLWRLLTSPEVETAIDIVSRDREMADHAFAVVIQAIAEVGASGSMPIGRALADTCYAEARFVRLLRARGLEDVAFEARQAARWCAVKGTAFQVTRFSRFVLDAALGHKDAAKRGHDIARDYFTSVMADAPGASAMKT